MRDVTSDNFGLLIAYLLPGFVVLWAVQSYAGGVEAFLAAPPGAAPTVGEFLYGTLGSTATGLIVSAVRWAVVDRVYHRTGIPEPGWDFRKLPANLAAFESHVQDHYRYYQFYSNMLVAVAFAYALRLAAGGHWPGDGAGWDLAAAGVIVVLVLGSRDTLRKYYARTGALLADRHGQRRSDRRPVV